MPARLPNTRLVDLAQVADGRLVAPTVARVLRVSEQHGRTVLATVANAIGNRRGLVVLDNCEHLVQACAELAAELLKSCRQLQILATSRESLRVPGEATWLVPPLALPGSDATLEALHVSEAVQLFLERAARRRKCQGTRSVNAPN